MKYALNIKPEVQPFNAGIIGWILGMIVASLSFYLPVKSQRKKLIPEFKQHYKFIGLITLLTLGNGLTWFYGMSELSGGLSQL